MKIEAVDTWDFKQEISDKIEVLSQIYEGIIDKQRIEIVDLKDEIDRLHEVMDDMGKEMNAIKKEVNK